MALLASSGEFDKTPATQGLHNAVFCEVFDIGAQPKKDEFREADKPGYRNQVIVVWQVEERGASGARKEIMQWVGLSTGSNSTLNKWFKTWIGADYKQRYGVGPAVDIEKAMQENPNCVLMVDHNDSGRAKVLSVAKGTVALTPENYQPLTERGTHFTDLQSEGFAARRGGLHKMVPPVDIFAQASVPV